MQENLVDLDEAVINALKLFIKKGLPNLNLGSYSRPLVVGSCNAAATGKILLEDKDAVFADESTYEKKLDNIKDIDGAVLISSFGGKSAPEIARTLKEKGIEIRFLTNNKNAEARQHIDPNKIFIFPKTVEPYTYNTSTYMGMILAKTKENPKEILDFIKNKIALLIPEDLSKYDAFYFIIPEKFNTIREMFLTKFDELFGANISGRAFTLEQTKHAKTIVPSEKELFVSLGYDNKDFGIERLNLPLPENADYGTITAIGYYFIGKIQKQNYPWFKENIVDYCKKASENFNTIIKPIVE